MRTLPGNPIFRISTHKRTFQHWLGSVPYTCEAWSAVLYTYEPRGARNVTVRLEASGVTKSDAVINLVRSWRLPC